MISIVNQQLFSYETGWFRLALAAVGLLLIAAMYRLRLRRATARLNARLDECRAERGRIADDMQDTLLQTVHGSKLVADCALEKAGDSVELRAALEKLSRWLGQATQEAQAVVKSLRETKRVDK